MCASQARPGMPWLARRIRRLPAFKEAHVNWGPRAPPAGHRATWPGLLVRIYRHAMLSSGTDVLGVGAGLLSADGNQA